MEKKAFFIILKQIKKPFLKGESLTLSNSKTDSKVNQTD